MKNCVFIATSLDGFIADSDGGIDWLHAIPNPNNDDMGYNNFINGMDAIIMGKNTFLTVDSFDMDWPYKIPVFVLSNSLQSLDQKYNNKVHLINGTLKGIIEKINSQGLRNIYIDGGTTIQNFLKADLINEMTITIIPKLLGGGTPLFGKLDAILDYECYESNIFLDRIVQNKYRKSTK